MMSRALTTDGAKKNSSVLREPASEGSGCERGRAMRIYRDDSETGVHPLIKGAHVVVYTKDAEADRAFFRDVLQFSSVDAGKQLGAESGHCRKLACAHSNLWRGAIMTPVVSGQEPVDLFIFGQ